MSFSFSKKKFFKKIILGIGALLKYIIGGIAESVVFVKMQMICQPIKRILTFRTRYSESFVYSRERLKKCKEKTQCNLFLI